MMNKKLAACPQMPTATGSVTGSTAVNVEPADWRASRQVTSPESKPFSRMSHWGSKAKSVLTPVVKQIGVHLGLVVAGTIWSLASIVLCSLAAIVILPFQVGIRLPFKFAYKGLSAYGRWSQKYKPRVQISEWGKSIACVFRDIWPKDWNKTPVYNCVGVVIMGIVGSIYLSFKLLELCVIGIKSPFCWLGKGARGLCRLFGLRQPSGWARLSSPVYKFLNIYDKCTFNLPLVCVQAGSNAVLEGVCLPQLAGHSVMVKNLSGRILLDIFEFPYVYMVSAKQRVAENIRYNAGIAYDWGNPVAAFTMFRDNGKWWGPVFGVGAFVYYAATYPVRLGLTLIVANSKRIRQFEIVKWAGMSDNALSEIDARRVKSNATVSKIKDELTHSKARPEIRDIRFARAVKTATTWALVGSFVATCVLTAGVSAPVIALGAVAFKGIMVGGTAILGPILGKVGSWFQSKFFDGFRRVLNLVRGNDPRE